ncbi:MAG: hypothetical protein IPL57_17795 [Rubrivivax sp.]|nr:hypothetical protein [Rubrivivax sp.]
MALYDLVQHGEVRLGGFLWRELRAKHLPVASSMKAIKQHLSARPSNQSWAAVDLHQLAHAGAALARAVHALAPSRAFHSPASIIQPRSVSVL